MGEYSYKPDRLDASNIGKMKHATSHYRMIKNHSKDIEIMNIHKKIMDIISKMAPEDIKRIVAPDADTPNHPAAPKLKKEELSGGMWPREDLAFDQGDNPEEIKYVHHMQSKFHHRRALAYNKAALAHAECCCLGESAQHKNDIKQKDIEDIFKSMIDNVLPTKHTAEAAIEYHDKMHLESLREMTHYANCCTALDKRIKEEMGNGSSEDKIKNLQEAKRVCQIQHDMYKDLHSAHCDHSNDITNYAKKQSESIMEPDGDGSAVKGPIIDPLMSPTGMNV